MAHYYGAAPRNSKGLLNTKVLRTLVKVNYNWAPPSYRVTTTLQATTQGAAHLVYRAIQLGAAQL